MRKTLVAALMVSIGLGSQAYAQKVKQGVMNFSLTRQYEFSTNFTPTKATWKTTSAKITSATVIKAIGVAIQKGFSSKAQLVIDQYENPAVGLQAGQLGGFYNNFGPAVVVLPNGYNTATAAGEPVPGKDQIFGQIYVKDGAYCTNVTMFFAIKVQECYDCFYLNSFITDSTFTESKKSGPPCCSPSFTASGNGKDKYYLTLSFDNTINNANLVNYGITGLNPTEDGVTPDTIPAFQQSDPYVLRFTLNGIVTYTWNFKYINSTDLEPSFIGSASYPAYGYGFIAKTCAMINGSVSIAEKAVDISTCCAVDSWVNPVSWSHVDWNQAIAIP